MAQNQNEEERNSTCWRNSSPSRRIPPSEGLLEGSPSTGVEVYKAIVGEEWRAIKKINKTIYATNYKKEVDLLMDSRMADCKYLVRYFSHEEEDWFCFIVMELCLGSLSTYVEKGLLYQEFGDDRQKRRLFQMRIIEGIAFLHDNIGLIHRDIKPSNVLVARDGTVLVPKIADYGISEFGHGGMTQLSRGTLGWKAPETFKHQTSQAVDVFAVGCLLYYIETKGGHPFYTGNSKNIEFEAQDNIDKFNPNIKALSLVEPTILDLICRALEREPDRRLQANQMLSHPAFLSNDQALYLLCGVAEKGNRKTEQLFGKFTAAFQKVIINHDWRECLDDDVILEASLNSSRKTIKKFKKDDYGKSIYYLLALIRDKYAHFHVMSEEVKALIGDPPDCYFEYWHARFPHLLVNTWKAIEERPVAVGLLLKIQNCIVNQFNSSHATKEKKDFRAVLDRKRGAEKKIHWTTSILRFFNILRTPQDKEEITLSDTASVEGSVKELLPASNAEKSYFQFLKDYPSEYVMAKQLRTRHDTEALKREITHRLRHRIDLFVGGEDELAELDDYQQVKISIYDAVLEVLKDFDSYTVSEIFRLLIEAKFTIPLFNPLSKKHYMPLLREIHVNVGSNEATKLGDDTKLSRLVLISRRKANESQALELLKNLFHVSSLHTNDLFDNCFTRQRLTIDLGIGCIARAPNDSRNFVLVAHVTGSFEDAADFIEEFADVLLVEDTPSATEETSFLSLMKSLVNNRTNMREVKVIVWKPMGSFASSGMKENEEMYGFAHINVTAQYGDKVVKFLGGALKEHLTACRSHGKCLSQLGALDITTSAMTYETVDVMKVIGDGKFGEARATLVLQRYFREQATYEESRREVRSDDTRLKSIEENINESDKKRREHSAEVSELPLIKVFLELLNNPNQSARTMALRQLEQDLDRLTQCELNSLQTEMNNYLAKLNKNDDSENTRKIKEKYAKAKGKYQESVLYIEHLWRELSHLYVADPRKFQDLPKLAAQHLMDGFSVELLDGEAGSMNLPWIEAVFINLSKLMGKRRIFVLSVMGIQSSGKSTLLNTMFGIKMRTSVGQCTRGINMQLVPVEGRPEYDYVLILDTEGTRSPEHWGMPGNEKRDNQMATLSILLADATIIVNPGENDAAVKEILPIVLMAYQNSKLAEDSCDRLSSMMFFVYNRIDTTQKERLTNIIQTLSNSLNDAINAVKQMASSKSNGTNDTALFGHFVLDPSNAAESDVRILGQNKKSFLPPNNAPDSSYGEALVEFREHIHKRVTKPRDGVEWKSHSPEELSKYLGDIWECICSADFNLQFADVVERAAFDQLEAAYQKMECRLAKEYHQKFSDLQKFMMSDALTRKQSPGSNVEPIENDLKLKFQTDLQPVMLLLDKQVKELISKKAKEKWQSYYEQRWELSKSKQFEFWVRQLHNAYDSTFKFTKQIDDLKIMLRKAAEEQFSGKETPPSKQQFNEVIEEFIRNAQVNYLPINVADYINDNYNKSTTIRSHQIDVLSDNVTKTCREILNELHQSTVHGNFVHNTIAVLIATLIQTKFENGDETSSQLASCLVQIYDYNLRILNGAECYDQAAVLDTIEKTDHVLRNSALVRVENSHRQLAHTFARVHLIFELGKIQEKWEATNSFRAKLKQPRMEDELWNYFVAASRGSEKLKLFAAVVKGSFSNLHRVYQTELMARTLTKLKGKTIASVLSRAQSQIEHYIIGYLRNNEFDDVIKAIRNPPEVMQMWLHLTMSQVASSIWSHEKPWIKFTKDLGGAVDYATKSALGSRRGRAQRYLNSLQGCLQKSLASETIAMLSLKRMASDDIDNERDEDFRHECQRNVIAIINSQSKQPQDWNELKDLVIDSVKERLRGQNGMTTMRCEHCCPWCLSVCTRHYGHDPSKIKHDTLHQPVGLIGREFHDKKILDVRSCCDIPEHEICFTEKGDIFPFYFRYWSKTFPDWEKPRQNQRNRLGEYILYHYHHELANYYGLNPNPNLPLYYNHDLNVIEGKLERKLVFNKN